MKKKEIIKDLEERLKGVQAERDAYSKTIAKYQRVIDLGQLERYDELMTQWGVQQRSVRDQTEKALGQILAAHQAILDIKVPAPE